MRLLALLVVAFLVGACAAPASTLIRFSTEFGEFDLRIEVERAPVSSTNFLRYVDAGMYTDGRFHRAVRLDNQARDDILIEVVQASVSRARRRDGHPPIALERTAVTGLRHFNGTISMARSGPDTGTSSFFICIGAQPSLDFGGQRNKDGQGFAVFGRVVRGMEVIRRIHRVKIPGRELPLGELRPRTYSSAVYSHP